MSSRGFPVTEAIRKFRRTEAEKRQAEYDKLTLQQKIDRLPPAPAAKRQRDRLLGLVNKPATVTKLAELATPVANTVSADEKSAIKAEIKAKKFNKRTE